MSTVWYCHCCSKKNSEESSHCSVCGRPESYVQAGRHLPLHGRGARVYRPSHIPTVCSNIYEADAFEWQAVHVAAYNGNAPVLSNLIESGANVNALTIHGQSPLFLAAYNNAEDCVSVLIEAKAAVNAQTASEKQTSLHVACRNGSESIVRALVEDGGCDVHLTDVTGRTALHYAAAGGFTQIGAYLIRRGAKHSAMDLHGWSPRQTAEYYGHVKFAEMIVRAGLTVQQSAIRELPAAAWHGSLWDEVVKARTATRRELEFHHLRRLLNRDGHRGDGNRNSGHS